MKLPKVYSFKVHKMLTDKEFRKELQKSVSIIRKYDIPYVAGYSKDGKEIYIDRHFESNWNGKDITKYLVIHEITEKALLNIYKLKYQQAHHIATHVERNAVVNDGLDWKDYCRYIDKYVKTLDHENLKYSPPNLDLTPYKDEKDFSKFIKKRKEDE